MRTYTQKPDRSLRVALLIVLVGAIAILAASCARVGPANLVRRAQSEVAALRPHPDQVPTPLAATPMEPVAVEPLLAAITPGADAPTEVPDEAVVSSPPQTTTTQATTADVVNPAPVATATAAVIQPTLPPPTPRPSHQPAGAFARLSGLRHEWQTWNNCGPATLSMQLSYFGSPLDQADIGSVLRTNPDDKNVNPPELVAFARSQGYQAQAFVNGDAERLKLLLTNGIPVLVETWLEDEPGDGMGHYRLLTGYDDAAQHWIAYDSYVSHHLINEDPNGPYQGVTIPYAEFEPLWKVFNRTYVLAYNAESAPIVESILGEDMDAAQMWQRSLQSAQDAVAAYPDDPFAWFNLGSSLVALGDYANAATVYDQARLLGLPWRMLWYQFGPFEAYYQTARYQEVVALADATISTTRSVEELFYWKGHGLAALGDLEGARRAWQQAVELNPTYAQATQALDALGG